MRITYLGNYQHSWCSEVHWTRELEGLGHDVNRVQEPPGGGDAAFLGVLRESVEEHGSELLVWTRTWGLPVEAEKLWRELENAGVQTASYHLDLYVGLKREAGLQRDPFWRTGTVFTPDGDATSAEVFRRHGINHVYSAPGVVSDECIPGTFREEYAYDVVFVGSDARHYHREWRWRGELLDFLRKRYGSRFHRFGNGDEVVRGQDLNDLYASAKVVVGDSLCPPGHVSYWSDRPYETVGRGGFLLMPAVPGLEQHFTDREHLRFYEYGNLKQVSDLVDCYLHDANEDDRITIAGQGRQHVAAHHTYRQRWQRALEVLETQR